GPNDRDANVHTTLTATAMPPQYTQSTIDLPRRALLLPVSRHHLPLRDQPILVLMSGLTSALLIKFIGATADFVFHIDRHNVLLHVRRELYFCRYGRLLAAVDGVSAWGFCSGHIRVLLTNT